MTEVIICRRCKKKRVNIGFGYCKKCVKEIGAGEPRLL